ncbi:MAG: S9 family peptidase [Nannocystaceae bacterium]
MRPAILAYYGFCLLAVGCRRAAEPPAGAQETPTANSAQTGPTAGESAVRNPGPQAVSAVDYADITTDPPPGTRVPRSIQFTPDDTGLTFLDSSDGSLSQQLYSLNPKTGKRTQIVEPPDGGVKESNLSIEEQLRRERSRTRTLGIPRYTWSKEGSRILVPLSSGVYVQDGTAATLRQVIPVDDLPVLDPRFSRDGEHIAYVQDDELYVVPSGGGTPRQITRGARRTGRSHGLAEYIAQEEMGRHRGYWWSHDGKHLAFTEVDETHIPTYRIMHQGTKAVGPTAQEAHRYPFAGSQNATVRLGVVPSRGGPPRWMELGTNPPAYLARVDWLSDGRLAVQLQNREQSELQLMFFDTRTGKGTRVLTESSETWVNLHRLLWHLDKTAGEAAGGFVWGSERNGGFQHLYLYDRSGKLMRPLTTGEWKVTRIVSIDQSQGRVYFMGTKEGALERHLYSVDLTGDAIRRITTPAGTHQVVIDHGHKRYVDTHSSIDAPPRITLRSLADNRELAVIQTEPDPRLDRLKLRPPELVSIKTGDGETLHGAVYAPPSNFGRGPWPIVVSVYGGPHVQRVTDSWGMTVDLRAQHLRQRGFLVFKLDNRGSGNRGLAFEGRIKHNMGDIEVRDQAEGVRWLVDAGLGKPGGAAIYGWSYGGYVAAMAMARAAETFKVGVAGAPVTHWDGYDTHYTERYMGTPDNNPKGYERSSVMQHVQQMTGELLLVHGLIDENVHFRHTARLINALIAHDKDYELLLFPDSRHGPRKQEDRIYLERRIFEFIERHL